MWPAVCLQTGANSASGAVSAQRVQSTARRRRVCPPAVGLAAPAASVPVHTQAAVLGGLVTGRRAPTQPYAGRAAVRCRAGKSGGPAGGGGRRQQADKDADWELPGTNEYSDNDLVPSGERLRPWAGINVDARNIFQLGTLFIIGPILLSTTLRISLIDPLVHAVQGDVHFHLELSEEQHMEVAEKVHLRKERLEYDIMMERAPHLSHSEIDELLMKEGQKLENHERERAIHVVSNGLSDGIAFMLLVGLAINYNSNLAVLRQGVYNEFLSLQVSTQACILLLVADVFVGYHSAEGWVTFLEMMVHRYSVMDLEEAENGIRLFVATVPVVMDVGFKFWVYRYLRKLSPSTQIILEEIERS